MLTIHAICAQALIVSWQVWSRCESRSACTYARAPPECLQKTFIHGGIHSDISSSLATVGRTTQDLWQAKILRAPSVVKSENHVSPKLKSTSLSNATEF